MKRALLISIHPKWAEKIMNGKKTIEVRSWMPKDYAGWVYVYVTKGKDILTFEYASVDNINIVDYPCGYTVVKKLRNDIYIFHDGSLNGKVAFRFWYEKVDTIEIGDDGCVCLINGVQDDFPKGSCLTEEELCDYIGYGDDLSISSNFAKGYAWHIDKLEIFDKPKELREFYKRLGCSNCAGIDTCPNPKRWGDRLTKAPQKCMWVYGGDQS